jgi:cytochrome c553
MKRVLLILALAAGVLGGGALLVAWSGLVPIAASSGHWSITSWFLHYTMRQSVDTWSSGIEERRPDKPELVHRGAGHYATACAACHGAPGTERRPLVTRMTPHPPYLPPRIAHWEPEELFWIVKHGVKFTGMPAWPTPHRDDEVWAMVAFLLRLPELSPQRYRELGYGELAAPGNSAGPDEIDATPIEPALRNCARCHGFDGAGRGLGAFPRLSGQTEAYLTASLRAYAAGERHSGFMEPVAADLSEAEIRSLARHYAGIEDPAPSNAVEPVASPDSEAIERGELIARQGLPDQGVPACMECHGPREGPRNPRFPILAGQYENYLQSQLELFREGHRGGTEYAYIMAAIAERLDPGQISDVAAFYASLRPQGSQTPEKNLR